MLETEKHIKRTKFYHANFYTSLLKRETKQIHKREEYLSAIERGANQVMPAEDKEENEVTHDTNNFYATLHKGRHENNNK